MRLLFFVMVAVLLLGCLFFFVNNMGTRVPVNFGKSYPSVESSWLVAGGVAFGILVVGLFGWAEGFATRLENRRLTKEIRRLETEVNYLRTTRTDSSPEFTTTQTVERPVEKPVDKPAPPSAPVYRADPDDADKDPDDDIYSGGRAV